MSDEVEMVLAGPGAMETVRSILEDASGWLHARGIVDQWPRTYDDAMLAREMAGGEIYLACQGGQAVGMLRLLWSDPEIWGERPDDAGYVHSLAIRRAVGGRGMGLRMLRWAEGRIAAAGRRYLRLDCWAENPELCRYYERAGFEPRGVVSFADGWAAARYEREVRPARAG